MVNTKTAANFFDFAIGALGPITICALLLYSPIRLWTIIPLLPVAVLFLSFTWALFTHRSPRVFHISTFIGALLVVTLFLVIEEAASNPYGTEPAYQTILMSLRHVVSAFGAIILFGTIVIVCGATFLGTWFGRMARQGEIDA